MRPVLNSSGVSAPTRKKSQCVDELGGDASLLCIGDHWCDLYAMHFERLKVQGFYYILSPRGVIDKLKIFFNVLYLAAT